MNETESHLFANLFSVEPDQAALEALEHDSRFSTSLPSSIQEARVEYVRLFTMNVYPYASVFIDDDAVLNGETTARVESFYRRVGFEVPPGWMVGAPDALGVEFECLAYLYGVNEEATVREFLVDLLLSWAPVCCLAVERNANLEFYRTLGQVACSSLMEVGEELDAFVTAGDVPSAPGPEELDLHSVVAHLLAPGKCGAFLSKQELNGIAQEVQIPIGFGDRGLLLANLLRGAGSLERVSETLQSLRGRFDQWTKSFMQWGSSYPRSSSLWNMWLARTRATGVMLDQMQETALHSDLENR